MPPGADARIEKRIPQEGTVLPAASSIPREANGFIPPLAEGFPRNWISHGGLDPPAMSGNPPLRLNADKQSHPPWGMGSSPDGRIPLTHVRIGQTSMIVPMHGLGSEADDRADILLFPHLKDLSKGESVAFAKPRGLCVSRYPEGTPRPGGNRRSRFTGRDGSSRSHQSEEYGIQEDGRGSGDNDLGPGRGTHPGEPQGDASPLAHRRIEPGSGFQARGNGEAPLNPGQRPR